jgi:hypothetical protein
VPPKEAWACPAPQPIKGNFTTYSRERCIYHMPDGHFYYGKTNPERCYATEADALPSRQMDGRPVLVISGVAEAPAHLSESQPTSVRGPGNT